MNFSTTMGLAIAALAIVACSKKDPGQASPVANAENSTESTAATAPAKAGEPAAAKDAPRESAATFAGTYTVTVGKMYVPDDPEFKSVKFKNDETKHLGEGKLTLAIDPSGRISGVSDGGPLGDAVFEGAREGDRVTAQIARKDASDEGLTGTLVGTREGDVVQGTMKLSEWNAAVVREATFRATRAPN